MPEPPFLRNIDLPTLLLDEDRCRRNIERMANRARQYQMHFRPHFKTHQSQTVGDWFRNYGVDCITVSSLRMAAYFAGAGWKDITVAFPFNWREIDRLRRLQEQAQVHVLVESIETLQFLERELQQPLDAFIKINVGNNRTGIRPDDLDRLDPLAKAFQSTSKVNLRGLLGHAGQTYSDRGVAAIRRTHEGVLQAMHAIKERYRSAFPDLEISLGDTPACSRAEDFPGIAEIRPGNFVYYDLMQAQVGACTKEDIAVAMACPVVAKHPDRIEVVVYGGAVHFSKDAIRREDGTPFYGELAHWTDAGWAPIDSAPWMRKLSQEHGILRVPEPYFSKIAIGGLVCILPVHSCLTADLMKEVHTLTGEKLPMMQYV